MEKDFVLVYTTGVPFHVEIAKERLTNAEIPFVEINQRNSVIPSFGDIEIYVHESNQETALDILKNLKN